MKFSESQGILKNLENFNKNIVQNVKIYVIIYLLYNILEVAYEEDNYYDSGKTSDHGLNYDILNTEDQELYQRIKLSPFAQR